MSVHLTDINTKNFNSRLKTFVKHSKSLRESCQAFIMFGLVHYSKQGDTVYLTKLQNELSKIKTIPSKTIQKYIMAHANVYLTKIKGVPTYKKRVGEKETSVTLPDVPWYDHQVNNENKVDFNLEKYEAAVIKKLEKEGIDILRFASDMLTIAKKRKGEEAKLVQVA